MRIPRVIHQTWKNKYIPEAFKQMTLSWREKHPGWEYRLWTDEMNRDFIKGYFPSFLGQYDAYPENIQRIDAVRYFVLYRFGGIYIDLDIECLENITELIEGAECVFGKEPEAHCLQHEKDMIISNAFMAAVPDHSLFRALCTELYHYKQVTTHRNNNILETTGPFMLSRLYSEYSDKQTVRLLPAEAVFPLTKDEVLLYAQGAESARNKLKKAFAVHYYAGTWWKKDTPCYYDASREQTECWKYHESLSDKHDHQLITVDKIIDGLDVTIMVEAINRVVRRHESLRTYFPVVDGIVKQCVIPATEELFSPMVYDMSQVEDYEAKVRKVVDEARHRLRDLESPPLFYSGLFKLPGDRYYLCLIMHHIISDTWSASVLSRELATFYEVIMRGNIPEPAPLTMQLRDYAEWQNKWLAQNGDSVRHYWANKLGMLSQTEFRIPEGQSVFSNEELTDILNDSRAGSYLSLIRWPALGGIEKLRMDRSAGTGSLLYASLQLLFYLLTGKKKILIAMPVINRFLPGTESIIGCLGGAAYLYHPIRPNITIKEFVKEVYTEFLDSATRLVYSYKELGLDGNVLRLHSDVFLNFSGKEVISGRIPPTMQDGRHEVLPGDCAYYALSCYISEYEDGLAVNWKYNVKVYSPEMIAAVVERYQAVLRLVLECPTMEVGELAARLADKKVHNAYS